MRYCFLIMYSFLVACSDSSVLWSDGKYLVIDVDGRAALYFDSGSGLYDSRVEAEVVEVASNKGYVVVKRCHGGSCGYYYIDKSKDSKSNVVVIGPLDYRMLKQESLRIPIPLLLREI